MMWTAERVRKAIETNDMDVCTGIVTLYRKQTKTEQLQENTGVVNGVGFNQFDARFLTSLAKQIIWNKMIGKESLLSPAQIKAGRKKLLKYAKQLAKIANGEL